MKQPGQPLLDKLSYFAILFVVAGALILFAFEENVEYAQIAKIIIVIGAVLFFLVRFTLVAFLDSKTKSRIPYIQLFSSSSLVFASYLLYIDGSSWPVFTLITGILELYTSFRSDEKV